MLDYRIIPIMVGIFPAMERSSKLYLTGYGIKERSPLISYLVQGDGLNILVDTGAGDSESVAERGHNEVFQSDDMKLINALHNKGVEPENIDFIVSTHLHWDHCWGNNLFPGKKIFVQRREIEFAEDPLPAFYATYDSEKIGMRPRWKLAKDQLVPVDGDVEVAEGITLVLLEGHTPGMQGVMVDTLGGRYMIGSDAISCYENWSSGKYFKRIPIAVHTDLAKCYESFEKIERLGIEDRILPGHDMKVFDHETYPYN